MTSPRAESAPGPLSGKVAVVTGAAHGLGREHALLLAREGAAVVVNDLDVTQDGAAGDSAAADAVVAEIERAGGVALASTHDVANWDGARELVGLAVERFGQLDVLVNNAGILRDRTVATMSEQEWDDVIRVHLKGHAAPLRFAAEHWRSRSKSGEAVQASVINTTSTSGLLASPGQSNYGAAKSGIATMTQIAAKELARYGIRVNAVAPAARTRMTLAVPALTQRVARPEEGAFDAWDPANVSPLVAWLASEDCEVTGQVFFVLGGQVVVYEPWSARSELDLQRRWSAQDFAAHVPGMVDALKTETVSS